MNIKFFQKVVVCCTVLLLLLGYCQTSLINKVQGRVPNPMVTTNATPISNIPKSSSHSCTNWFRLNNPFFVDLKENGVDMFESAESVNSKCGDEWLNHGTCCHEDSLFKYVKKVDDGFIENTKKFPGEIERLLNELEKTRKEVKGEIDGAIDKKEGTKPTPNSSDEKGKGFENNDESSLNAASHILDEMEVDEARVRGYIPLLLNTRKQCVDRLNELRNEYLCKTCSGRMEVFFIDSKAKLPEAECRDTISKCFTFWNSLINLTDVLEKIQEKIIELKKIIAMKVKGSSKSSDEISDWLTSHRIILSLSKCPPNGDCEFKDAANICDTLITIREPSKTLLNKAASLIERENERLMEVPNQAPKQQSTSGSKGKKRLLQDYSISGNQVITVSGRGFK